MGKPEHGTPSRDPSRINCGAHRGERIADLPNSYLRWAVENFDPDGFWRPILEREIERRGLSEPNGYEQSDADRAARWAHFKSI